MREKGNSYKLAKLCSEIAFAKKAKDIAIIKIKGISDIADYFVVMSASSGAHIKGLADNIEYKVQRKFNEKVAHRDGSGNAGWLALDYIDVIVHIFLPEKRLFYDIDGWWADAPREEIKYEEIPKESHQNNN